MIAGLLKDLKSRGLLEETLVLWGGEFGRMPTRAGRNGRDHNLKGIPCGSREGREAWHAYGLTDEYGYYAVENKASPRPSRQHAVSARP
ncbi:MAG: DUF1501 domain-containing protein [Planctomycetota bacterium]